MSVTQDDTLVQQLAREEEFTFTATFAAGEEALPERIVVIEITDSNGKVLRLFSRERRVMLPAGEQETVSVSYEIPTTAVGPITVSALAWTDWLSRGGQPIEGTFTEERYDIR
jgi:hypothetical protein